MSKVYVVPLELADCTCDPHSVRAESIPAALEAVLRVCESSVIQHIESIHYTVTRGSEELDFESDHYTVCEAIGAKKDDGTNKTPTARSAEEGKLAPFLYRDADVPAKRHLPAGLFGLRALKKLVPEHLEEGYTVTYLTIGVVWAFAGDHSCSDYIEVVGGDGCEGRWEREQLDRPVLVGVNSQDWWANMDGHDECFEKVGDIFGSPVDMSQCVRGRDED